MSLYPPLTFGSAALTEVFFLYPDDDIVLCSALPALAAAQLSSVQ